MFLLIEDQGAQGYELFFKTRELKKKWMEQFEMAMWAPLLHLSILRER